MPKKRHFRAKAHRRHRKIPNLAWPVFQRGILFWRLQWMF